MLEEEGVLILLEVSSRLGRDLLSLQTSKLDSSCVTQVP